MQIVMAAAPLIPALMCVSHANSYRRAQRQAEGAAMGEEEIQAYDLSIADLPSRQRRAAHYRFHLEHDPQFSAKRARFFFIYATLFVVAAAIVPFLY